MTGISRKTMIPGFVQLLLLALLPSLVLAGTAEQRQARIDHLEHAVLARCSPTASPPKRASRIDDNFGARIPHWRRAFPHRILVPRALPARGVAQRPVGLADFLRVYHGHRRHVHDVVDFGAAL
jgi:hypothetical protein